MRAGPFRGAWLLPGGGIEPGEQPEDAVRRELREETGTEVSSLRATRRYEVRSLRRPGFRFDVHGFRGTVRGGLRPEAGSAVRWFEPRELRDAHPVLLRELADEGVSEIEPAELARRLRDAGVEMRALER
jgi:8-oxo-dGTP diphosphatase